MTNYYPVRLALCSILLLVVASSLTPGRLLADSTVLDQAVKKYYQGETAEAIAMIRPLASAGDPESQYLLGNILFTLSNAGQLTTGEDPARWYRLAAEQNHAAASYALGIIHNNRWLRSHRDEDLQFAESYLQQASDLGVDEAGTALEKLAGYRNDSLKTTSLTYSNESFSSKQTVDPGIKAAPTAKRIPATATPSRTLSDTLAGFESSGDLAADAEMLRKILSQLNEDGHLTGEDDPDAGTLSQLLQGIESTSELLPDLLKLFDHLETASEISTAPGSN